MSARLNAVVAALDGLPVPGPYEYLESAWGAVLLAGAGWGDAEVVCACNAPAPPREMAAKSITLRVSNE